MVFTTSAVGLRSHVDLGRVALAFTAPVTVIHIEPNEPDLALSGVGGHSIHGLEDLEGIAHRSMVVDRFGLRIGGDEQKLVKISRLGCR